MSNSGLSHTHLTVEIASNVNDIIASQKLRYEIFSLEQGALLESAHELLDRDYYDAFCHHLILKDLKSGNIVGSTRILTEPNARDAGSFYSENEFNLDNLLPLKGNAIEIGRTCIHPDYRNGTGIATLWLGLAGFMEIHQIDYMFGCASISLNQGEDHISNIMQYVSDKGYYAPPNYRVTPHTPLDKTAPSIKKPQLPPLLKAYLSLGAWVVGQPSLDLAFNVADLFILLDVNKLNKRYQKRFMSVLDNPLSELSKSVSFDKVA